MGNYCKYYKKKKQVSYDSGATWQDVTPAEYQKGELYEPDSQDCGYIGYFERWTDSGTTCNGYDLYNLQVKEVSNDMTNWTATSETQLGTLIEADSTDCGYVYQNFKVMGTFSDGNTHNIECDNSTLLTRNEVKHLIDSYSPTLRAVRVGDCVTEIGYQAFDTSYCGEPISSITISNTVTGIGASAFDSLLALVHVDIPDSVTVIGISSDEQYSSGNTFRNCTSLSAVTLPSGLTKIYNGTFAYCRALSSITIPSGVTEIGSEAFERTALTSITIPSSVTSIGHHAFYNCDSLSSITIPDTVLSIDNDMLKDCSNLRDVYIGSGLTSTILPNGIFENCGLLTGITLPSTIKTIGTGACSYCTSLTSLNFIPSGVTIIRSNAFEYCSSLTSITFPPSLSGIGREAFLWCSGLLDVTIPDTIIEIENNAFYQCQNLQSVTCLATTPPTLGRNVFYNARNLQIFVPANSVSTYKTATNWSDYKTKIFAIPT